MENELFDSDFSLRKDFYEESKRKAEQTIWEDKKQGIRITFSPPLEKIFKNKEVKRK